LVALIAGDVFMTVSGVLRKKERNRQKIFGKTNAACVELIFRATMARDRFFDIPRVIRFDDKTARNQWSSGDKLASIRDVFKNIISRFPMEYTYIPNDNITADEQFSRVEQ
jgi:hypothetical protein